MARVPRKLTLEYSGQALDDLDIIWEWNAASWGVKHANGYIAYLKAETFKLTRSPKPGKPVPSSTAFRYAVIKRRTRGHGHLVVFTLDDQMLRVLHYYHTSQDWHTKLAQVK